MTITPTGCQPHPLRRENLPSLAGRTETSRLHDRVSEVVVVFSADFAPAQAYSQTHGMVSMTVAPFHALLHGHATRESGGSRGEDHHEPVAQVLDLGAPCLGDGLTQDREVFPTDLVRGLG